MITGELAIEETRGKRYEETGQTVPFADARYVESRGAVYRSEPVYIPKIERRIARSKRKQAAFLELSDLVDRSNVVPVELNVHLRLSADPHGAVGNLSSVVRYLGPLRQILHVAHIPEYRFHRPFDGKMKLQLDHVESTFPTALRSL